MAGSVLLGVNGKVRGGIIPVDLRATGLVRPVAVRGLEPFPEWGSGHKPPRVSTRLTGATLFEVRWSGVEDEGRIRSASGLSHEESCVLWDEDNECR